MLKLLFGFFTSKKYRVYSILMGLFVILLSLSSVGVDYFFNVFYGNFYNALELKDAAQFWYQLKIFGGLALAAILLGTFSRYFNQVYSLKWREYITNELVVLWLNTENKIEGASQRIQEDCLKFTKITEELFLGILKAVTSLLIFCPVLWRLSAEAGGYAVYLFWAALAYSIVGVVVSFYVGRKLPKLEYDNQVVEAKFRKQLVLAEDDRNRKPVSHYAGLVESLRVQYMKLFNGFKKFTLWQISYFQLGVIVPYLFVAPSYFAGGIMLGLMVQSAQAFGHVSGSLSYLTERWMQITELMSVVRRLNEFYKTIS